MTTTLSCVWIGDIVVWASYRRDWLTTWRIIEKDAPLWSDWIRPIIVLGVLLMMVLMIITGSWVILGSAGASIAIAGVIYLFFAMRGWLAKYILLDIVIGVSLVSLTGLTVFNHVGDERVIVLFGCLIPVTFRYIVADKTFWITLTTEYFRLNAYESKALAKVLGVKLKPTVKQTPVAEEPKPEGIV